MVGVNGAALTYPVALLLPACVSTLYDDDNLVKTEYTRECKPVLTESTPDEPSVTSDIDVYLVEDGERVRPVGADEFFLCQVAVGVHRVVEAVYLLTPCLEAPVSPSGRY